MPIDTLVFLKKHLQVSIKIVLIMMAIWITDCTSTLPKEEFPTIDSTFVVPHTPEAYVSAVILPDGKYLTLDNLTQIELQSGEISRPFDTYLSEEWQNSHHIDRMIWSADGRYLILETHLTGSVLPPVDGLVYIIDTQDQTVSDSLDVGPILTGSPFGERILADPQKLTFAFWQVYDINTRDAIAGTSEIHSIEKEKVGGSQAFLWSQKLNLPIAAIVQINPINFSGNVDKQEVGINLIFSDENGVLQEDFSSYSSKFVSLPPDNIVSAIFDPSGEYLLIAQWKCSGSASKQCSLYPGKEYFDNIVDTAFILLRWRTGEEQELIRLSEIDPHNVVAQDIEWSADGSTILVWRKDAPPVVLKIKYP